MNSYYIYKITNLVNSKIYIGQTKDPQTRWNRYLWSSKKNKKEQIIVRAIIKHGCDNFIFELIDEQYSQKDIDLAEVYFIEMCHSCDREYGYNIMKGGDVKSGWKMSDEGKMNISNSKKIFSDEDVFNILSDNRTQEQIAKDYGVHRKTIRNVYKKHNRKKSVSDRDSPRKIIFNDDEVINILNDTRTYKEIGKDYGVSHHIIYKLYIKNNKNKPRFMHVFSKDEIDLIKKDNRSLTKIANDFNVSRRVITRIRNIHNKKEDSENVNE